MIKISLLFFLIRVFPDHRFQIFSWVTMAVCFLYGFVFFMVTLFQCWPIDYAWKQLDVHYRGTCHNENLQSWLSAIFNIILDLIILILPVKPLWDVKMGLKKKLLAMSMFCLGIL